MMNSQPRILHIAATLTKNKDRKQLYKWLTHARSHFQSKYS